MTLDMSLNDISSNRNDQIFKRHCFDIKLNCKHFKLDQLKDKNNNVAVS